MLVIRDYEFQWGCCEPWDDYTGERGHLEEIGQQLFAQMMSWA